MPSWNKGKTGLEAGWTPERRQKASEKQRKWIRDNPQHQFWKFNKGTWKTGPDPEVRRHYYRYMRMKCQARYWCQEWTILWEDYLDLLKSSSGDWGRGKDSINLVRRDRSQGWHIDNVELMNRSDAMKRPRLTDSRGKPIRRKRRNG
jgi:hypothetical protein